jgi:hypothetical protein
MVASSTNVKEIDEPSSPQAPSSVLAVATNARPSTPLRRTRFR